jgi:hypothetical protein
MGSYIKHTCPYGIERGDLILRACTNTFDASLTRIYWEDVLYGSTYFLTNKQTTKKTTNSVV